ncbi:hypothetical protein FOA52_010154 [Chlamydomonas sp. UWO 241]|nr:hypothetical protein FOA52_010154 [Chlamydomonas sp. UWO 241]
MVMLSSSRHGTVAGAGRPTAPSLRNAAVSRPRGALQVRAAAATDVGTSYDGVNQGPTCATFTDHSGRQIQPMCVDYGFRSGGGRLYQESYGETPGSVWSLAKDNFDKELLQLRQYTRYRVHPGPATVVPEGMLAKALNTVGESVASAFGRMDEALEKASLLPTLELAPKRGEFQSKEWTDVANQLSKLKLSNQAVAEMEHQRVLKEGDIDTPFLVKAPFLALCFVLDVLYDQKPIAKFWVLETVARIPYFAYISILHLYESLGFWRAGAELRKIHFAEEWNEMHHLQIMESLGGDQSWFDRFVAEHSAIAYYWLLIVFYLVSPKVAYNFMQRVELHAMDTYAEFIVANAELLKTIPPPSVALSYYLNEDLYLFDQFQSANATAPRRPECSNLYDVFVNIRDDELEHVKTMDACRTGTIAKAIAAKTPK